MQVHSIDYIILLLIAVIAVLVLLFIENNVTIVGSAHKYNTIPDFDAVPLKGCNPLLPENAEEITDSGYYETTTVYFNKCYPKCLKITTIRDRKLNVEVSCGS